MSFSAAAGETFMMAGLSQRGTEHLWIVIAEDGEGNVVIVNVNTVRVHPEPDLTMVLEAGDHPSIFHKSYVNYGAARITQKELIQRGERILPQLIFPRHDCDTRLLVKIQKGALDSMFTPMEVADFCREAWPDNLQE